MAVRPLLAGALAGLVLLATACGGDDDDSSATTAAAATTTVAATTTAATTSGTATSTDSTDGTDATDAPSRIVSLSATHTETLFAIGAGDQVIAVDDQSNYPPEAAAKMTDLSGYTPNVEAIAGYEPDLVVISGDDKLKSQLEDLGLEVWVGESATTFDEAYTQIEQLGAATGHVAEAAELVGQMQSELDALAKDIPTSEVALAVFHELDDTGYAAGSNTFIGQVYELFGLANIADAADDPSGFPQLSKEAIIDANPDLIFLADTKCCGQSLETVRARPGWADINAVKNGHVFAMDDDIASRWGPRVVEYARQVHDAVQQVLVPAG
jgi:iron complex transport system substrate-binding protein